MTRTRPIPFLLGAAAVGLIALAAAGCGGGDNGASAASSSRITYTPTGGDPRTQSRGLVLKGL